MSSPEQPARRTRAKQQGGAFEGFAVPTSNYFRMPNDWINISSAIDNIAELKVVQYILRHTWGYREYGVKKHITIDEFIRGRKKIDGTRIDLGTGLSERAVRYGLGKAVEHGLIEEETDDSDRGRVKKWYGLKMRPGSEDDGGSDPATVRPEPGVQDLQSGVQTLHPQVQGLQGRGAGVAPRTEKDTLERHPKNNTNVVVGNLTEFGISKVTAQRLAEGYSESYLRDKLAQVQWLQKYEPRTVGKNPAGYLRRAIEEDYQPPSSYKSADQLAQEEQQRQELAERAEQTFQRQQQERRKAQDEARAALTATFPALPIDGSELTTQTAWQKALENLAAGMTPANYTTWLKDTLLASCNARRAVVVAPSAYVAEWLDKRMRKLVEKELRATLGFSVAVDFVVATSVQRESTALHT